MMLNRGSDKVISPCLQISRNIILACNPVHCHSYLHVARRQVAGFRFSQLMVMAFLFIKLTIAIARF
jgi:hypothetical protein